jgi:hypothetical protein
MEAKAGVSAVQTGARGHGNAMTVLAFSPLIMAENTQDLIS